MRLNRYLAAAGLGSRRSVEELIKGGRVRINGHLIEDLATKVGPQDVVKVGNRVVRTQVTIHAILNKPRGYVVTADDELDRRTIYDLLPAGWPRVFHVGRLDKESEGLLIVTNDGELSLALTHPRYKIDKEYEVTIDKPLDPAHREKLLRGFHIQGGRAKMEEVQEIKTLRLRVVLRQGLKRQIRLMLYELGYEVTQLRRVRIGMVELGHLHSGEWRLLNSAEIASLRQGESPAPAVESRPPAAAKPEKRSTATAKPAPRARSAEDRAPRPPRGTSRGRRSDSAPRGDADRAGKRPERRGPQAARRSDKSHW
jgi:23S rRNA pseudouridine2605 synthase